MMVGQEKKWSLSTLWFLWTLLYQGGKPLIFLSLLFCSLLSASNNARHNVETKAME